MRQQPNKEKFLKSISECTEKEKAISYQTKKREKKVSSKNTSMRPTYVFIFTSLLDACVSLSPSLSSVYIYIYIYYTGDGTYRTQSTSRSLGQPRIQTCYMACQHQQPAPAAQTRSLSADEQPLVSSEGANPQLHKEASWYEQVASNVSGLTLAPHRLHRVYKHIHAHTRTKIYQVERQMKKKIIIKTVSTLSKSYAVNGDSTRWGRHDELQKKHRQPQ